MNLSPKGRMNLDELSTRPTGQAISKRKNSKSKNQKSMDLQAPIAINSRMSSMGRSQKNNNINLGDMDFKQETTAKLQNRQQEKILMESEAEYMRRGDFHLIFPFAAANAHSIYKSLYSAPAKVMNTHLLERFS